MNLTYKHECISITAIPGGCPVAGSTVFVPSASHSLQNEVIVPEVRCKHTGSVLQLVAVNGKPVLVVDEEPVVSDEKPALEA